MRKKHISILMFIVMTVAFWGFGLSSVYAVGQTLPKTVTMEILLTGRFTVTNAEGQYFTYKGMGKTEGTMEIISKQMIPTNIVHLVIEVNASSSFTFEPDPNNTDKESDFVIRGYPHAAAGATNASSITIGYNNGNTCIVIDGNNISYGIAMSVPNNENDYVTFVGKSKSRVVMEDTPKGVSLTGASGITTVTRDNVNGGENRLKSSKFIPYSDPVLLTGIHNYPFKVKGAYVLNDKLYKGVYVMHAYRIEDTSLMVTWGQVKNAKGYMVYRYNSEKKKYVKVKTIKNPKYTMFVDSNLPLNKAYTYRVKSYTMVKGKTKASKLSYYVSAVTSSDTRDNATKIVPNKASVSGKAGAKISIKGTVTTVDGKKVCSSSLRWFSKNKKVATITKAGKLTLKAKGKTYIWAKAHNGKNVVVKVIVK